jgi:uncharacterized ion transporter superfamily protein YfcC
MTDKRTTDPLLLLGFIIVVAAALTWVIPAGQYQRSPDSQNGRMQVVPGSYQRVPARPVGLGGVLLSIPQGLVQAAPIVFFVLLAGAALTVVELTGAVVAVLDSFARYFAARPLLVLPLVSLLFLFGGASYAMGEEIVAFIPLLCALMRRLHIPSTMAVAVSLGSAAVASEFSPFNTYILGIAHPMVGLPLFSGFVFRSVVFAVAIPTWLGYLMWQTHRMRRVHPLVGQDAKEIATSGDTSRTNERHYLVLIILNSGLAIMVVGAMIWSWDLTQFCAVLIAVGVLAGLAGGLKLRGTSEAFAEGLRRVALAAVLVGVARAVSVVLEQGMILDTITDMLFRPLQRMPRAATGVIMLASQSLLSFPMPSSSGKAMLTLPILTPLADLLHISRQVVVLSYQYGLLSADLLTPTYGALLAMLNLAQVPFTKWLKLILPIYLILFSVSLIAIVVAVHIGLQ